MSKGIWWLFGAAGLGAFVVLWQGRGYPWPLAFLVGLAIGALAFTSLRTAHNLWWLSTRRPPSMEWSDATGSTPPHRSEAGGPSHRTPHRSKEESST